MVNRFWNCKMYKLLVGEKKKTEYQSFEETTLDLHLSSMRFSPSENGKFVSEFTLVVSYSSQENGLQIELVQVVSRLTGAGQHKTEIRRKLDSF